MFLFIAHKYKEIMELAVTLQTDEIPVFFIFRCATKLYKQRTCRCFCVSQSVFDEPVPQVLSFTTGLVHGCSR